MNEPAQKILSNMADNLKEVSGNEVKQRELDDFYCLETWIWVVYGGGSEESGGEEEQKRRKIFINAFLDRECTKDFRFRAVIAENVAFKPALLEEINTLNGKYRFVTLSYESGRIIARYDIVIGRMIRNHISVLNQVNYAAGSLFIDTTKSMAGELMQKLQKAEDMALPYCQNLKKEDVRLDLFQECSLLEQYALGKRRRNICKKSKAICQKYDRIVCSESVSYSMDCVRNGGINNNVIGIGSTGSGKTRRLLEANLRAMNESNGIVQLVKPRLIKEYSEIFRKKGYIVDVLDLTDMRKSSVRWDCLHYVTSTKEIGDLADLIIYSDPRSTTSTQVDPYWNFTSRCLFCAVAALVMLTREEPSIADVIALLRALEIKEVKDKIETSLDPLFETVREACHGESSPAANFCLANWQVFRSAPFKTAGCIYSTLVSQIMATFSEEMLLGLRDMSLPVLCFEEFQRLEEKHILFVKMSPINQAESLLSAIFFTQAMDTLFDIAVESEEGRLARNTVLMCDDAALTPIKNLPEYSAIIREIGLSTFLLYQDYSQLQALYNYKADVLLNNANTLIFLGGQDVATAEKIGKIVNKPMSDILWMPKDKQYIVRYGEKAALLTPKHPLCLEEETASARYRRIRAARAKEAGKDDSQARE